MKKPDEIFSVAVLYGRIGVNFGVRVKKRGDDRVFVNFLKNRRSFGTAISFAVSRKKDDLLLTQDISPTTLIGAVVVVGVDILAVRGKR